MRWGLSQSTDVDVGCATLQHPTDRRKISVILALRWAPRPQPTGEVSPTCSQRMAALKISTRSALHMISDSGAAQLSAGLARRLTRVRPAGA